MSSREPVRAVLLAALLVVSTFSMVGVGAASASTGNTTKTTFQVSQGENCYEVSALGDGSQTVEEFYDYRSNETDPKSFNYSSYGTTYLQDNQESKLFLYDGENGYSLVMLHDKYALDGGDGSNASTITFSLSGMPDGGEWAVKDDTYGNDSQDDNWDTAGNTHQIDWMWASNRTDGGAFLGVENAEITVNPGFNDEASEWGSWDYSGDADNEMTAWKLIDGDQSEQDLDMSQSVTVAQGGCAEDTSPTAAFSVSDDTVANDETVEFDGSNSSDDGEIVSYDWDFGDGTTATGETTAHSYDEPGEYTVTLTVTDDDGNADTASANVTVEESDDGSPEVTSFDVRSSDNETVEVIFHGSSSITDIEVEISDENDSHVATLTEEDFTASDAGDYDEYRATTTVESSGSYTATLLKAADADGNDAADGQTGQTYVGPVDGSIEYVNATTAEVTGEFERVWVLEEWYAETGPVTDYYFLENVSGTTTITANSEGGINGTALQDIAAEKHANDDETDLQKANPYGNASKPYSLNLSVADVTETGDGTYEVTFEYVNPNDGRMIVENSQFTTGNVDGEPPETFYPGENATTVTWTPDSDDERVTWEVNQSNFDLDDVSASTEPASDYGGAGDGGDGDDGSDGEPTAKLSLSTQTADFSDKIGLNASGSTDDGDVVEYRWDFDGDGEVDRTTPDDATDENNPAHTVWHDVYKIYEEPGTYAATVTVVDDDGNTDTATEKITIEQNDDTKPSATLDVPPEVTIGEEFTVKATDFTENDLAHVCWVFGDHDAPDGATATHRFEEVGEHEVTLHLVDKAGNSNMLSATITVTEADGGSDDPSDPPEDDPNDPPESGLDDDPNDGSTGGGLPPADSSDDSSNDDSDDDQTQKKAALDGTEGTYGEFVLSSSATDATVEVTENVSDEMREPTADRDGFEALTYVTVSGADDFDATFTVSKDRLDAAEASPEDVTLFQFEDGSWSATETEQLNETDDAFQFGANATNGTYAVGIDAASTAVEDLRVDGDRVAPGDAVTVTVTVENDGRASGTEEVDLTVDGETVATKNVSVEADSTTEIEFTRSFDAPGVYEVSAADANAEIVVEGIETETTTDDGSETATTTATETGNDGGVPGFGVGAALSALAAAALLARRQA